jgi:hypothetical protein
MAELKTQRGDGDVEAFIDAIDDERKREDSKALVALMERVTGEKPAMWGPSIVGFGDLHYKYETGREGDWFRVGFSPRKQNLTLYVTDYIQADDPLLAKLGKFTTSKACIYVKRLDDIDPDVLGQLVKRAYDSGG